MDEEEYFHTMTYAEREGLKAFAARGECLAETLLMIAHWMPHSQDVTFSGYASNWAEANRNQNVGAMRKQWQFTGPRFIADDSSDWGGAL